VDDPEDGRPYRTADRDEQVCPQCGKRLPPDGVLCPRCGFHLRKREKVARTYEPLARRWELGLSLASRVRLFVLLALAAPGLGVLAGLLGADLALSTGTWVLGTVLLAFLLGTCNRLDLTRDRRGRVRLTQNWRVAFVPLAPRPIDLREFDGVVTGRGRDAGFPEKLIFVLLLLMGVVPGIVWWFCVVQRVVFYVALAQGHGFPAATLYRGWREEQALELAHTLSDAAGLPYRAA
jgi:hypothetical protein